MILIVMTAVEGGTPRERDWDSRRDQRSDKQEGPKRGSQIIDSNMKFCTVFILDRGF